MHRFSIETQAEMSKNHSKKKNPPTMEEELEQGAYRKESGELYFPAEWFYQTLLKASGEFGIPGRGKKSYRDFIKSTVVIEPEQIGLGIKEYSIDARPIVIRATRGRIVRYRPHIPQWSVSFDLVLLDEDLIDTETLNAILVRAGATVGIGDYRPRYGRFVVEKFKEKK